MHCTRVAIMSLLVMGLTLPLSAKKAVVPADGDYGLIGAEKMSAKGYKSANDLDFTLSLYGGGTFGEANNYYTGTWYQPSSKIVMAMDTGSISNLFVDWLAADGYDGSIRNMKSLKTSVKVTKGKMTLTVKATACMDFPDEDAYDIKVKYSAKCSGYLVGGALAAFASQSSPVAGVANDARLSRAMNVPFATIHAAEGLVPAVASVPEPCTLATLAVAGSILLRRRRGDLGQRPDDDHARS